MALWAFMRAWEKDTSSRVVVALTDRFSIDSTYVLSVLGSVVAALGGSASLVAVSGGSHVLTDTYGEYLGNGYSRKLVEYPVIDLRLQKRCLQKVSSSVFGSLDPFSMTEFIVTRLRAAEHRDWMMSRSSVRHAIITGELSLRRFWRSSSTSWEYGLSPWSTFRRLVERPTATTYWYKHSPILIQLQFLSHFHLAVFFRRMESMIAFIVTRWQEANCASFI